MDKVFLERPSVNEVLRDKIRKYKKEHSRLSSNQIARRLGLPPSTFHRLEMGDVKNPGLDICVTVLNGLASKKDTAEFVREYFPEVHESLYGHFHEMAGYQKSNESIDRFFKEPSTFKMMMKASTKYGLSEQSVLQENGRVGHKKFMELAANGVLQNKDGRFYTNNENMILDIDTRAKLSSMIYQDIAENCDESGNAMGAIEGCWFESLDAEKVVPLMKELVNEFNYQMSKIMMDPNNAGKDVIFYSSLVRKMGEA
ncbi:hypothetical protein BALOs_0037 [Halobacteriovorax sp. BALOs_7]|uniref:hypothetical protein n=1 Tax=Halobacteriovorax sp. BALOs_7 TaxID=2109558 RepID=UPI000EA19F8A|nr:hypothetical protein [Halobacteriovorax sp. BALOs_7]AYF43061.1 hypothetical protein BALOs_0037 [Halobacteriovorax sp. BALOs_7]